MKLRIVLVSTAVVIVGILLMVEMISAAYFLLASKHFYRPAYLLSDNLLKWRTEFQPWGAWHLANTSVRDQSPCYDVEYHSNSIGARDIEHITHSDKKRIVFLGDSMVEGLGVRSEDRFSDVFQSLSGIESLNFGAAGHVGPVQYSILYNELASQFEHTDVVIGFFPFNDFTDNDPKYNRWERDAWRYRPYYTKKDDSYGIIYKGDKIEGRTFADFKSAPKQNILDYTWFNGFIASIKNKLPPKSIDIDVDVTGVGYYETSQARIDAVIHFFHEIIRSAKGKNIWILIIPSYAEAKELNNKPSPWLVQFKQRLSLPNVHIIDIADSFSKLDPKNLRQMYLDCDGHLSVTGNKIVASILANEIPSN